MLVKQANPKIVCFPAQDAVSHNLFPLIFLSSSNILICPLLCVQHPVCCFVIVVRGRINNASLYIVLCVSAAFQTRCRERAQLNSREGALSHLPARYQRRSLFKYKKLKGSKTNHTHMPFLSSNNTRYLASTSTSYPRLSAITTIHTLIY